LLRVRCRIWLHVVRGLLRGSTVSGIVLQETWWLGLSFCIVSEAFVVALAVTSSVPKALQGRCRERQAARNLVFLKKQRAQRALVKR